MKVLFIVNDPPYGTQRVYNALRLALALLKKDPSTKVTIFLMANAALAAKVHQKTPDGYYDVERMPLASRPSGIQPAQRSTVAELDAPRGLERNHTRLHEMRERARHRFDGEAEIVGDVLARHRQLDRGAAGAAVGHLEQEARNALLRALDQDQRMLLHALQLAYRQGPELLGEIGFMLGAGHHACALDHQNLGMADRLG